MSLSPFLADCAVSLFDSSVIHTHLPFLLGTVGPRGLSSFCVFTNSHNLAGTLGASLGNYILQGPQDYLVGWVVIIAGQEKSEVQLSTHSICNAAGWKYVL